MSYFETSPLINKSRKLICLSAKFVRRTESFLVLTIILFFKVFKPTCRAYVTKLSNRKVSSIAYTKRVDTDNW